ncbi:HAMP domain-containing sensor histidine kinase [uncultured Clostridium sp.]|uniref:sensor histidine kinase n=1 Tax=uncultured Clostridium sp. TaxID=59620 RepID=UPI00261B282B|nr:HAMP domain-containing sensor histidine kinase [uncultured Clostridium sp.]
MIKSSIKNKLIRNFLIVIFFTIIILDMLLAIFVKKYYYDNTEVMLINQIDIASNFYDRYYSTSSLISNIYDNVDAFWNQSTAQVQIFDNKGNLIMDSIAANNNKATYTQAVKEALKGITSRWVGNVSYCPYKVMAVTKPLKANGEIIGVIRFTTSLQDIDKGINSIISFFIVISIAVLIIGITLSLVMAKSIVDPILKLEDTAKKIASGDLNQKTGFVSNDEIGQLASTIDYMAEELQERDKMKNDFISSVSHELRTPLTAIKGWVITLKDDNTDKETLDLGFNIIEKETERLSAMVEELLDFSRLTGGNISLKRQNVSLDQFSKHIEAYMKPRAYRENINFAIVDNARELMLSMDVDRMKQVLINLLDNSFKFTDPNGEVKVIFDKEGEFLVIEVIDSGCGIQANELPRVKEKFYKGSNAKSNAGIGLSIADEIINLHNGTFEIESVYGEGTSVVIKLPIILEDMEV